MPGVAIGSALAYTPSMFRAMTLGLTEADRNEAETHTAAFKFCFGYIRG